MPPADFHLWQKLVLLAGAGAAGTLARFGLSVAVQKSTAGDFPWGTVAVNAVGCLLFGIVWALADERLVISVAARAIVLVGFMGAFTTFSAFAFDTLRLIEEGHLLAAAGNVLLQNVAGVVLLVVGIAIGRAF
jgi:CrcB protein